MPETKNKPIWVVTILLLLGIAVLGGISFWQNYTSEQKHPISENQPTIPTTQPLTQVTTPKGFTTIFLIVMENKESSMIVGNPAAPYINSLMQKYASAGAMYAITHPSLPNYLALLSGSTHGMSSDCLVSVCPIPGENLVDQFEFAGISWKGYMEDMPSACYAGATYQEYAQKHNPFIYFTNIRTNARRCGNIVPFTQLGWDMQAATLPHFVWITPNLCHDMHDCSIQTGDTWLASFIPTLMKTSAYQHNGVIILTWDEGTTTAGCCLLAAGGKIPTLFISQNAKAGFMSELGETQYDILHFIEANWKMSFLGSANNVRNLLEYFQF